jgi:hypothetical protein
MAPPLAKKSRKRPVDEADVSDGPSKPSKKGRVGEKAPSAKEASKYSREDLVQQSYNKNPEHVFVIGPPRNNWVDNAFMLAGYVGFSDMEAFRLYLLGQGEPSGPSKLTHQILENFNSIRNMGFGKAVGVGGLAGISNASLQQIWLALGDMEGNYHDLFQPTVNLPLPEGGKFKPGNSSYVIAVNVAAMSFLVQHNPHIFTSSHVDVRLRPHCPGRTNVAAEDWYRAFLLVKFYVRQTGIAKGKTGFFSRMRTGQVAQPADYFTLQDIEDLHKETVEEAEGDLEGRAPADVMNALYDEVAAKEVTETLPFEDVVALAEFTESTIDQWEVAVDDADKKLRNENWSFDSAGRTSKRVRLTQTQLRQVCRYLGQKVKVKHDDPAMEDALTAHQKSLEAPADHGSKAQVRRETIVSGSPA